MVKIIRVDRLLTLREAGQGKGDNQEEVGS